MTVEECRWCRTRREMQVPATHVFTSACIHEHISGIAVCAEHLAHAQRKPVLLCHRCHATGHYSVIVIASVRELETA